MFEKRPKIITLDTIDEFCNQNAEKKKQNLKVNKEHTKEVTTVNIETIENNIPIKIKKEKTTVIKQNVKKEDVSEETILWL